MSNLQDTYTLYSALLNQCDKEADEIYHYYAARHELSDAALWILYALYNTQEPLTQTDLCSYWFLSRQTIHTALGTLKRQGFLTLAPFPGNRKNKQLVFTARGKAMAQQVILPLQEAEQQVFAAFSPEENQYFVQMSQRRCALLRQFLADKSSFQKEISHEAT